MLGGVWTWEGSLGSLLPISQSARTCSPTALGKGCQSPAPGPCTGRYRITPLLCLFQEARAASLGPWVCASQMSYASTSQFSMRQITWEITKHRFLGFIPDSDAAGQGGAQEFAFLTSFWQWPWPRDHAVQPHCT